MGLKEIVKEAYDELMKEMTLDGGVSTVSPNDVSLGDASSQLAKSKGELAALLNKAERAGIISRQGGKIQILDKVKYSQLIGDLPKKIKLLQAKLEPESEPEEEV